MSAESYDHAKAPLQLAFLWNDGMAYVVMAFLVVACTGMAHMGMASVTTGPFAFFSADRYHAKTADGDPWLPLAIRPIRL